MAEYVLALSYGNYIIQNGGTDKVIREHRDMFNKSGCNYLFIFPVVRTLRFGNHKKEIRFWGMNINSEFIGIFSYKKLCVELKKIQEKNECLATFIHHMWRVKEKELMQICKMNDTPIFYYLHDFYSICNNCNFTNESGKFCGYSFNEEKCNEKCGYYYLSKENRRVFAELMETFGERIICIAPSENTKNIFLKNFRKYEAHFRVIEHQRCAEVEKLAVKNEEKLRVAFIGAQAAIKGWNDFKNIKDMLIIPEVELFYLGTGTDIPNGVKHINVSVREQGNMAMQEALRNNKIDVVLLLSCWPETYSYTYYESLSAGCYVIAYKSGGNIAEQVMKRGNGKVFNDFIELDRYIGDFEKLKDDVLKYKNSGEDIPSTLVPNDEIIKMVKSNISILESINMNNKFYHRACIAELLYRIQNRRKFNGMQK